MSLRGTLQAVIIAWAISEIALGFLGRAKRGASVRDRGSIWLLWAVIAVSVAAGVALQFRQAGSIAVPATVRRSLALGFVLVGLVIRWAAIIMLGRLFTSNVAIQRGHTVVRSRLYRAVRHPSYTGLLLAFLGLSFSFGNWLSVLAVMLPIMAALSYRIRVEERALVDALGDEYLEYCNTTKRLIPGVY